MPKILYILDLYAQPFPLLFKKHKTYKSKLGLIIGIFSLSFFIYFFIRRIYNIFLRTSFYIVEETRYVNSPKTTFQLFLYYCIYKILKMEKIILLIQVYMIFL